MIAPMQGAFIYSQVEPMVKLTKTLTRRSAYAVYCAAAFAACSRARFLQLGVAYVVSRRLNEILKKAILQPRPYCEFSDDVTFFRKKKSSQSFPSQSVQTLAIAWYAFADQNHHIVVKFCAWYIAALIALVALVRIYRGLHYPHDIAASVFVARVVVNTVASLLERVAGSHHLPALLVTCFSAAHRRESEEREPSAA